MCGEDEDWRKAVGGKSRYGGGDRDETREWNGNNVEGIFRRRIRVAFSLVLEEGDGLVSGLRLGFGIGLGSHSLGSNKGRSGEVPQGWFGLAIPGWMDGGSSAAVQ